LKYWNTLQTRNTAIRIIVYTGETEMAGDSYQLLNWKQVNTALWQD
jgi:hypothetical protein